jgi:hypothetical protein
VRRGVGERLDDLQLLDDRARPSVRDDQRQRVLVLGADVDEVNVQPVDLGYEVRPGVQSRFALASVRRPIRTAYQETRHAMTMKSASKPAPVP